MTSLGKTLSDGGDWRRGLALLGRLAAPHARLAALNAFAVLLDISGMMFVPTELAALVNAAVSSSDMVVVWRSALAMLVASVVGSGGAIASVYLAARLASEIARDLRVALYEASLAFSAADFEEFGAGSMVTRTLSDMTVVQQTILTGILMIVPVPVMCVVSVALAWSVDPAMGCLLLGITAVVATLSFVAVGRSAPVFMRLQGFIDRMNTNLRESITGVRVIRAFGREEADTRRLDKTFSEYAESAIRVNLVFSVTDSLTFFVMNLAEVLVVWLGANRVGVHAMQIGSITALVEYAINILFFFMMMQFAILSVPRAMACLSRADEVLSREPRVRDPATPVRPAAPPSRDEGRGETFRFDHVSLRFSDADECTLRDLCFSLPRGEITAIIGNTGSGKSTIAKMLLRLHDATEGRVLLGGVDVRDMAQADLRVRIAYVPQRAWLFSGTIAQNMRHGNPDATDEEIWHALDVAQASFVRELTDGIGARVSQGGTNFSGGQRQRLAIARALVRKADLYVFDDSFSALDYKTDAALRRVLREELADAATLIIAQRVSTIRDAGQIVVLRNGSVEGLGTHEELMASCATYRAIEESQTRGGADRG